MIRIFAMSLAIAWLSAGAGFAAEQEWTGRITDSLCGASHGRMSAMVAPPLSDPDCTVECVNAGGKYELVGEDDNMMPIENQDFAGLETHAGHTVKITGELKSGAIVVSKIEMPAASR